MRQVPREEGGPGVQMRNKESRAHWIHPFVFTKHLICARCWAGSGAHCEIAALQEQLLTSEAAIHSLQAAVRQRDELIQQLQPRAKLLQDICRRRPPLVALLADLAEAERLGPLPASDPGHLLPSGPGPPLANSTGEKADQDHPQPTIFGTTV
ncbi:vimentin-type intermediate filament-associated coiled-coil protein isoform X2 [Urocitellus parryii]